MTLPPTWLQVLRGRVGLGAAANEGWLWRRSEEMMYDCGGGGGVAGEGGEVDDY